MRDDIEECQVMFREKYAMAQSQKNLWTRLVNTWKCVMVSLSPTDLRVRLHGVFGVLVMPFMPDLDHTVPISAVRSAVKKRRTFGYDEISVVFDLQQGGEREILLYLKNGEEFLNLLNSFRSSA